MSIRAFPETRETPKKRILLIPFLLMGVGLALMYLHPILSTGFIGSILALAGALTVFLVGMVFADLWAASHRTRAIIKARQAELQDESIQEDPFEERVGQQ